MKVFHNTRDIDYRAPYGAVTPNQEVTLTVDVMGAPNAEVMLRTWFDGVGERLYDMSAVETGETPDRTRFGKRDEDAGGATSNLNRQTEGPDGAAYHQDDRPDCPGDEAGCSDSAADCPGDEAGCQDELAEGSRSLVKGSPNNEPDDELAESAALTRYRVTIAPAASGIVWYHFIVRDGRGNEKRYGAQPGRVGGEGQLFDWEPPSFQLTVHEARDMPPAWHEMIGAYLYNDGAVRTIDEIIQTTRENFPFRLYETAYPWSGEMKPEDFPCFSAGEDVFGFWSEDASGNRLCTLVNTSLRFSRNVAVRLVADEVSELVGGYDVRIIGAAEAESLRREGRFAEGAILTGGEGSPIGEPSAGTGLGAAPADVASSGAAPADPAHARPDLSNRYAHVHLHPLCTCVLHFHEPQRLQQSLQPGLGVLAHITSLPAEADATGEGTLGEQARAFVDQLAQAGVRYWQVLPASPTDNYGSPYAGISAFAGNTRMLEGSGVSFTDPTPIPRAYAKVAKLKAYQAFCERERDWLEPYAAFMAIRQKFNAHQNGGAQDENEANRAHERGGREKPGSEAARRQLRWQEWPEPYRSFDPAVIEADEELRAAAEAWRQSQYLFQKQWSNLHAYANERGVLIVGDMPLYVSADSADAWAHPDIFQLDACGWPTAVAGCAPDAFAPEGQVWGNPLYDWDACRASGYDWWLRRLKRSFELYDFVRLDHFIGFSRYFCIPVAAHTAEDAARSSAERESAPTGEAPQALGETPDATQGTYRRGPGIELFQRAYERFGPLPVIAEDLGLITPAVRDLSESCGFMGMDIAQFVDGNDPLSYYRPRPGKIAYTGTHDNQTLVGYCAQRYPHLDARETAQSIMESVACCEAPVCIVPLQDLIGLGDEARMNTPGTTEGNWSWQARAADLPAALETARELVALHEKSLAR